MQQNGLHGFESKGTCCVHDSAQCGGPGCSAVDASFVLGAEYCCEGVVLNYATTCEETEEAPPSSCVNGGTYCM